MSWRNEPKIRDLEPYAKKHGYAMVVVVGFHTEAVEVNTYGRNLRLCGIAGSIGSQVLGLIESGVVEPELPREADNAT